jgi:hypothetical protein
MLDYIPKFGEKVTWGAPDTEQMGHLADDGDIDQSFNEASHDRRGDESGHPAHAHDAEKEQKRSDQNSKGGG